MTSQATMNTNGTLSHAIRVPVRSVNLSMRLTALIRPGDGAAGMPTTPLHGKKKGDFHRPFFGLPKLLLLRFGFCRFAFRRRLRAALRPIVVRDEGVRRGH